MSDDPLLVLLRRHEAANAAFDGAAKNSPREAESDRLFAACQRTMQAIIDKDTLGGVMEIVALHVPPGLGTYVHYDRRLDARIIAAMVSIQAMKGAEIGPAFENAGKRGTEVHDEIMLSGEDGYLTRKTNRAGGIEGGISTGEPIVARVAMKPISTVLKGLETVDVVSRQSERAFYERSDTCAVPAAGVVAEQMVAIVLAQECQRVFGGDTVDDFRAAALSHRSRLAAF